MHALKHSRLPLSESEKATLFFAFGVQFFLVSSYLLKSLFVHGTLTGIDLSGCTGLTAIKQYVFKDCKGLTRIDLPTSLTTIGTDAFGGCTGLTSIDLSDCTSLTIIGNSAFEGCTEATITLPNANISIESYAFGKEKTSNGKCTWCAKVKIPKTNEYWLAQRVKNSGYRGTISTY